MGTLLFLEQWVANVSIDSTSTAPLCIEMAL